MFSRHLRVAVPASTATGAQTGNPVYIGDAHRVGIILRRSGGSSGNTVFTFKGSLDALDGTNAPTMSAINVWVDDVTNTNVQQLTRIGSKTLSNNPTDSDIVWLEYSAILNFIEVDWNTTTDGTAYAAILVEKED